MKLVTVVTMCLASVAFAQEEQCLLEASALKAQFAAKLPKGFRLESTKKANRRVTQVLKTDDGHTVTLEFGGCSHLAFSFAIRGGGLTSKTVGSELVAISKQVLNRLPMAKDAVADPKLLVRALDEARIATLPADLPCGDARCSLALRADEPKVKPKKPAPAKTPKEDEKKDGADAPGVVTISYDMAI